jgi:hypothetical protein
MELKQIIVPLALFVCITYAFRVLVDAIMRYRMLREPGTEDLLRSILQGEQAERRLSSLRWGLLATFLATGFAIIDLLGLHEVTPGAIGILLAATGLSHHPRSPLMHGNASTTDPCVRHHAVR